MVWLALEHLKRDVVVHYEFLPARLVAHQCPDSPFLQIEGRVITLHPGQSAKWEHLWKLYQLERLGGCDVITLEVDRAARFKLPILWVKLVHLRHLYRNVWLVCILVVVFHVEL